MNKMHILVFVAGAAIGSLVTWRLVEARYKKLADEEIESVKDVYSKKNPRITGEVDEDVPPVKEEEDPYIYDPRTEAQKKRDEERKEYSQITKDLGYSKDEEPHMSDPSNPPIPTPPYVISPDDFGEDDYDTESLTYYADGTLTDEWDNPITDVDGMVGYDSFDRFGEYEKDSVFVRNEQYHTDYEILRDERKFEEVEKHG